MEEVVIEIITVLPKNQFTFIYMLNEGHKHSIKKENLFKFLKTFLDNKDFHQLRDFISRFRPFIIFTKNRTIMELSKIELIKENLQDYIHSLFLNFTPKQIEDLSISLIENKEKIPNDNIYEKMMNKTLQSKQLGFKQSNG